VRVGLIMRSREGSAELAVLREWVSVLRGQGHEVWPRLTFEAGDAVRQAVELAGAGAELVVAAGGDGTVNEVVNGVLSARWAGRLGVVPLGTGNDFAAGLGLPVDPEPALRVALGGEPRAVDVGRVNGRWFVNVSTGGFGVEASGEASEEVKRVLGPLAYVMTGVRAFTDLEPSRARFRVPEGVAYDGDLLLFAVGNGRRTGGGNHVTPRARPDDGELDVVIVPAMSRLDFLALLPDLRSGDHLDHEAVRYFRTDRLVVECAAGLSVNADGEPVPGDRFEYDVAPRRLTVMAPAAGGPG
jgi:diacylglycerol kinase (ATP)